jgi:hypothetical protein
MPVKGEIMASQLTGILDAFDFAYGINPNGSGALQVINGSNVAGTYTVTCAPQSLVSADGLPIILGTNTTITIGADSNMETVAPTAISLNQLNQVLITAVFAFAHSTGDTVRSGTKGIAEAVNYAHSIGGALVSVSSATGITQAAKVATLGAILGYANAPLLDYLGVGGATTTSWLSTGTTTPVVYTTASGIRLY